MPGTIHAFDYLQTPATPAGVNVLFGDEPLLKQLVLKQLRQAVLGEGDPPYQTFDGAVCAWRDVADELATVSLFSAGARLAVVDQADKFVAAHRSRLESYAAAAQSSAADATGALVLIVDAWAGNTRLYKTVDQSGLQIDCRAPQTKRGKKSVVDQPRLLRWLGRRAAAEHNAKLAEVAGELLLDLIGPELGLLDTELAKLALLAGPGGTITPEQVRDSAAGWRTKSVWELVDSAAAGDAAAALAGIDRLLSMGEAPQALFAQLAWSLRRYAAATRIYQHAERTGRRLPLSQALEQAGFRKWPRGALEQAEGQLKQLGRHRAGRLYRWLLEADVALKGTHSQADRGRLALERLLVRLSRQAREISPARMEG